MLYLKGITKIDKRTMRGGKP